MALSGSAFSHLHGAWSRLVREMNAVILDSLGHSRRGIPVARHLIRTTNCCSFTYHSLPSVGSI